METSPQIILASASPRRAALLEQIGVRFQQQVAAVDEKIGDESAAAAVVRLAREKASSVAEKGRHALPILGADTVVVEGDTVLQKPNGREEAVAMLQQLSGSTHQVMSAVALVDQDRVEHLLSISQVTFRTISEQEQSVYWESGEPVDKAGGYAIQGIGAIFIERLEGSYSGVMGLPLYETTRLLSRFGVTVL